MIHNTNQSLRHSFPRPGSGQVGFTLVEMLFYLLFVTFIIGSTLGIVQHLLRNSQVLKTGISIEEEGNFILKKISWAVNDPGVVNYPALNSSSSFLSVDKNDLSPSENPIIIDLDSGIIRLARGSNVPKQLNNDRFVVSNLSFVRSWDGSNPDTDLLKASFEINSREFQITRKLR